MTIQTFLCLLAVFSAVTSLFTEAVKLFLDSLKIKYASNLVVLAVSVFVAGVGMSCVYLFQGYAWTVPGIISIFLMIAANWLVSMLGYDKVMQAITQLKGGNSNE